MVTTFRTNFGLKLLSLFLAILGWAYFRFATNPLIAARFDEQFSVPIAAVNVPAGYLARFGEKTAVVTIEPKRGEPAIKPAEIKAVVDLSNRSGGVYNVPVQLVAPSVAVQSLSPASVTLSIQKLVRREFPLAMHYRNPSGAIVGSASISPSVVMVSGAADLLSQIAAVRVDVALPADATPVNAMVRPVPVDSAGKALPDLQVAPNLVRVRVGLERGNAAQ